MRSDMHVPPPKEDIEANRLKEPEGERLRAELTDWLDKNGIVSILMDTEEHQVQIDIAPRLPPRIKNILSRWGSIYVKDPLPDPPAQTGGGEK